MGPGSLEVNIYHCSGLPRVGSSDPHPFITLQCAQATPAKVTEAPLPRPFPPPPPPSPVPYFPFFPLLLVFGPRPPPPFRVVQTGSVGAVLLNRFIKPVHPTAVHISHACGFFLLCR
jgi:hypothetical protein